MKKTQEINAAANVTLSIANHYSQKKRASNLALCFFMVYALLGLTSLSHGAAPDPPPGWYQVNQDGFVSGLGGSDEGTRLFVFNNKLYAINSQGFFSMQDPVLRNWTKLTPPIPPAGPGPTPSLILLGNYLYAWDSGNMWTIAIGQDPNGPNWNKVTSIGLPGGVSPYPWVLFDGKIYGVYYTSSNTFEIWRTSPTGLPTLVWERVVENGFSDPTNNHGVDIMIVFNGHIYAGTRTLGGVFGDPGSYGTGVEIWESPTGNIGSWTQVNVDGFGTKLTNCGPVGPCNFPIHQVIGSAAVYKAPGQTQEFLYIGTLSHFGGEIWRYDGNGLNGWQNVTQPWGGPCAIGCGPFRDRSMAVFQDKLYVAEGFPTGNLAKYDGTAWSLVLEGPHPFDPDNIALDSLAVFANYLYVSAGHYNLSQGDQVWAYPFAPVPNVKANGSDGPVTVSSTTPVNITISLDAGGLAGRGADYYFVALAPWGFFSLTFGGWVPGIVPFAQFWIFSLSTPLTAFYSTVPAGTYIVFFALDDLPDGQLNGTLWWDAVLITSNP